MKTYLGDGVYAQIDDLGRLVLTTKDGNWIVPVPQEFYAALVAFVARTEKEAAK